MIASFPMYDRPELQAANDRLWTAARNTLNSGPAHLTRAGDLWEQWTSEKLIVSQTCGYPYRARLHGKVQLVGTPDNGLEGCAAGEYYSVFVARADDPRETVQDFANARFAYNEPLSQSGWAAPSNYAAECGFAFSDTVQTGGHALSAQAVAEGRADLAALDALTWLHMQRYDGFTKNLRVIARTDPTPTLPFVTSLNADAEAIRDAMSQAIDALSPEDRETLSVFGLIFIPAERYLAVPNPAAPSA